MVTHRGPIASLTTSVAREQADDLERRARGLKITKSELIRVLIVQFLATPAEAL